MLQNAYTQKVTYWAESAIDGFGNRSYNPPTVFIGRWEDRTDLTIAFEGEVKPSKAIVYLQQDVALGDFLALGDRTVTTDPTTLTDAYVIKVFVKMPSISGGEFIRKVML